ncbi:uncharacterized protein LOC142236651 isoform X2 [Haematobia irritans]|uniref:uncharacterized protein LOC142236651 isoform X2 n=1 Tax=Haematobia irritans TaxID=7368 RepID=UPI003F4FD55B
MSLRKTKRLAKFYPFVDETYREIRNYVLDKDEIDSEILTKIINKYRRGCYEIYNDVLECIQTSQMLAESIARVLDLLKDMSLKCGYELDEFRHRLCELIAIYISCKLRLNTDCDNDDVMLIENSIVYIMRRHLIQAYDEEVTRQSILQTLVYIPRFFNARNIMCKVFEEFLPFKPPSEVQCLPDKLYILYIIVFYRWMKMQIDNNNQELIINFAESFMKPRVSLCTNQLYCQHLPVYTRHSTATRTILKDMKFYKDLRNACIIDNAFKISGTVNICDDNEEHNNDQFIEENSSDAMSFAQLFSAVSIEVNKPTMANIKREELTIVDSVDLTVEHDDDDDGDNTAWRCKQERYDNWLEKLVLLAKQYNTLRQANVAPNAIDCVDVSLDEDETLDLFEDNNTTTAEVLDRHGAGINQLHHTVTYTKNLRTYETKKSNSFLVPSVDEDEGFGSYHKLEAGKHQRLHHNNARFYTTSSISANEKYEDSFGVDSYGNYFHSSSPRESLMENSYGPGVPFSQINLTCFGNGGGKNGISSENRRNCNKTHADDNQLNSKKNFCGHCDSSSIPAYPFDKNPLEFTRNHSKIFDYVPNMEKQQSKPKDLIAAQICRNTFDLPRNRQQLSTTSPSGFHSMGLLMPIESASYSEVHPIKRSSINLNLRQIRTKMNNDDIDTYLKQCPRIETKILERTHQAEFRDSTISNSNLNDKSQLDKMESDVCYRPVIEPTQEMLQYQRQLNAMYNEILQKQRRKLELRALEKTKEKERRKQEKQQKREKFEMEQCETMKQLEKMNLYGRSDEEELVDRVHTIPGGRLRNIGSYVDVINSTSQSCTNEYPRAFQSEKHPWNILTSKSEEATKKDEVLKSSIQPGTLQAIQMQKCDQSSKSTPRADISSETTYKEHLVDSRRSHQRKSPCKSAIKSAKSKIQQDQSPPELNRANSEESTLNGDSREMERNPLCSRKRRPRKKDTQHMDIMNNLSTIPPAPECRQNFEQLNEKPRNLRGRKSKIYSSNPNSKVDEMETTDSEFDYQISSSTTRTLRERHKNSRRYFQLMDTTTDSDGEHRSHSSLRQSPRLLSSKNRRKSESKEELLKRNSKQAIKVSAASTIRRKSNIDYDYGRKMSTQSQKSTTESEISKQATGNSLSKDPFIPDSTSVAKEYSEDEQEDILYSIGDFLVKENLSNKNLNKFPSNEHEDGDVEMHKVIEKIVINEIQREMEAESIELSKKEQPEIPYQTNAKDNIIDPHSTKIIPAIKNSVINQNLDENQILDELWTKPMNKNKIISKNPPLLITEVKTLPPLQICDQAISSDFVTAIDGKMEFSDYNSILNPFPKEEPDNISIYSSIGPSTQLNEARTSSSSINDEHNILEFEVNRREAYEKERDIISNIYQSNIEDPNTLDLEIGGRIKEPRKQTDGGITINASNIFGEEVGTREDREEKNAPNILGQKFGTREEYREEKKSMQNLTVNEATPSPPIKILQNSSHRPMDHRTKASPETISIKDSLLPQESKQNLDTTFNNSSTMAKSKVATTCFSKYTEDSSGSDIHGMKNCRVILHRLDLSSYLNKIKEKKAKFQATASEEQYPSASILHIPNRDHGIISTLPNEMIDIRENWQRSDHTKISKKKRFLSSDPIDGQNNGKIKKSRKTVTFNSMVQIIDIPSNNHEFQSSSTYLEDGEENSKPLTSNGCQYSQHTHYKPYTHICSSREEINQDNPTQETSDVYNSVGEGSELIPWKLHKIQNKVSSDAFGPSSLCSHFASTKSKECKNAECKPNLKVESLDFKTGNISTKIGEDIIKNASNSNPNVSSNEDKPQSIYSKGSNFENHTITSDQLDQIHISSSYAICNNEEIPERNLMESINKTMMSPSEQEVSSTQESMIKSNHDCSISITKMVSSSYINSAGESSNVLQNNQVDTTNHSMESMTNHGGETILMNHSKSQLDVNVNLSPEKYESKSPRSQDSTRSSSQETKTNTCHECIKECLEKNLESKFKIPKLKHSSDRGTNAISYNNSASYDRTKQSDKNRPSLARDLFAKKTSNRINEGKFSLEKKIHNAKNQKLFELIFKDSQHLTLNDQFKMNPKMKRDRTYYGDKTKMKAETITKHERNFSDPSHKPIWNITTSSSKSHGIDSLHTKNSEKRRHQKQHLDSRKSKDTNKKAFGKRKTNPKNGLESVKVLKYPSSLVTEISEDVVIKKSREYHDHKIDKHMELQRSENFSNRSEILELSICDSRISLEHSNTDFTKNAKTSSKTSYKTVEKNVKLEISDVAYSPPPSNVGIKDRSVDLYKPSRKINQDDKDLHEIIEKEIYTMATDVTIPKPNLIEFKEKTRDKVQKIENPISNLDNSRLKLKDGPIVLAPNSLREPTTTGVKSAVNHGNWKSSLYKTTSKIKVTSSERKKNYITTTSPTNWSKQRTQEICVRSTHPIIKDSGGNILTQFNTISNNTELSTTENGNVNSTYKTKYWTFQ